MEHRLSIRRTLNESSIVECPRIGRGPATIRDISPEGMRIECRLTLPVYAPVSIDFSVRQGRVCRRFRFDAMVVRMTTSGAGLMFDLEETQFVALHHALEDNYHSLPTGPRLLREHILPRTPLAMRRAS